MFRPLQIGDHRERESRQHIAKFHFSALQTNRAAGKQVVRRRKRKRFGKFKCGILPEITDWREADPRRKPRRNDKDPLVFQNSDETDATFDKGSMRMKRQVFAALKQFGVLATKSQ